MMYSIALHSAMLNMIPHYLHRHCYEDSTSKREELVMQSLVTRTKAKGSSDPELSCSTALLLTDCLLSSTTVAPRESPFLAPCSAHLCGDGHRSRLSATV